jgi:hypothetical protein
MMNHIINLPFLPSFSIWSDMIVFFIDELFCLNSGKSKPDWRVFQRQFLQRNFVKTELTLFLSLGQKQNLLR